MLMRVALTRNLVIVLMVVVRRVLEKGVRKVQLWVCTMQVRM